MSSNSLNHSVSSGITLTASGSYISPFTVTSTGTANSYGTQGTNVGLEASVYATVFNAGHIGGSMYGLDMHGGGYVYNSGAIKGGKGGGGNGINTTLGTGLTTVVNTGYIYGTNYGVIINAGGPVTNHGSIIGINDAGIATNGLAGPVRNYGLISGYDGVKMSFGGTLVNESGATLQAVSTYGNGVYIGRSAATINNAGNIHAGGAAIYVDNAQLINIRNSGLIEGGMSTASYAAIDIISALHAVTIENSGVIANAQEGNSDAISLTNAALDLIIGTTGAFVGNVTTNATLTNMLELESGASAGTITGIGSQFTGFSTLTIDAGAAWTLAGNAAGLLNGIEIGGFFKTDTINLTGTLATSDSYDHDSGILTLFSGADVIGEMHVAAEGTALEFFNVNDDGHGGTNITTNAICYLRGTRLVTAQGERPVEDIRAGDLVAARNGGLQPVRWVGRQSFARSAVENDRSRLPVCIRAGALGAGLPARDLYVSPGHSMLLGETLILARHLVNGVTITQNPAPAGDIDYYQFELTAHDCLMAEGCWSESFADGPGLRAQFHNFAAYQAAHPDYVEPPETALCAPRPLQGEALEAALQPILALAAENLPAGPLEGWIDDITSEMIAGWAIDTTQPELPVRLEIWAGAKLLGITLARTHRTDLEAAGKGNGQCAFFFPLPPNTPPTILRVQRASDATSLPLATACRDRLRHAA